METFNFALALEMAGDEKDLLKELIESFINEKNFDLNNLIALEQTIPQEAASYVHYFKGAARQLAAEKLASIGQELEDVLRQKKTGDLDTLNCNFAIEYDNAVRIMKDTLQKL